MEDEPAVWENHIYERIHAADAVRTEIPLVSDRMTQTKGGYVRLLFIAALGCVTAGNSTNSFVKRVKTTGGNRCRGSGGSWQPGNSFAAPGKPLRQLLPDSS